MWFNLCFEEQSRTHTKLHGLWEEIIKEKIGQNNVGQIWDIMKQICAYRPECFLCKINSCVCEGVMCEGSRSAAAAPPRKGTVSHTAETYSLKHNITCLHLTNADTSGTAFTGKGLLKAKQLCKNLKLNICVSYCKSSLRPLYPYRHKTLCF